MKWPIVYACLITAGFAAARGQEQRNVTTKPATKPNVLTVPELLALADQALSMERPVRGVDRYWLVAVALVESGGDPNAVGDGGRAVGLHQFHSPAWSDCWGVDTLRPRNDALSSFQAAIRYAGKARIDAGTTNPQTLRRRISVHHHLGHYESGDKEYYATVERRFQTLVKEYGGN